MNLALASSFARRLASPVLAVVFPSECAACGQLLLQIGGGPLCEPCWRALPHSACIRVPGTAVTLRSSPTMLQARRSTTRVPLSGAVSA